MGEPPSRVYRRHRVLASSCAVVVLIVKIYREGLCLTVLRAVEPTLYPRDVPQGPLANTPFAFC
jgi:hypothetical protein